MKIRNIDDYTLANVIRRLKSLNLIEDDGKNYIIPKPLFESAFHEASKTSGNAPKNAQNNHPPAVFSLLDLLKAYRAAYKNALERPYKAGAADWAKFRRLCLSYGTEKVAEQIKPFFNRDDIDFSVTAFFDFVKGQHKIGNL